MFPSPLPSQKNVYDEWNGKHGYNIAPAVHGEHTKNVYWTPIRRVHLSDDVEFFFALVYFTQMHTSINICSLTDTHSILPILLLVPHFAISHLPVGNEKSSVWQLLLYVCEEFTLHTQLIFALNYTVLLYALQTLRAHGKLT